MSLFRQRAIITTCVLIALLATAGLVLTDAAVNPVLWLAGVSALFLLTVGALDPWLTRSRATELSSEQQLNSAASGLTHAVTAQLRAEREIRELEKPGLLNLSWKTTMLPITDQSDNTNQFAGSLDELPSWFCSLPKRRLVILGPPGSGKSSVALLLALELMESSIQSAMVPVPLSLASWNTKENLRAWMAHRLREDHPALRNAELYGSYAADLLVEQRRILPVFDAFDEIPPALRKSALEHLNQALPPGASLVLTSRPEAYAQAVGQAGPLRSAAVIDLSPISHVEVAHVLRSSSTFLAAAKWEPLLLQMHYDPRGPIARVFSNPLIIWLARTRYAEAGTNPSELLDSLRFPDQKTIEDHLLNTLLSTLFPENDTDYLPETSDRWEPALAKHWLAFLARRIRNRELPWWELRHVVHRYWLTVLGAIALGLVTATSVAMMVMLSSRLASLGTALIAGAASGCAVTLGAMVTASSRFRSLSFSWRIGIGRSLLAVSAITGTAAGLTFGALFGAIPGLLAALAVAITTTLRFCLNSAGELGRAPSPQDTLARDRALVGLMCLIFGVGVSAVVALLSGGTHSGLTWLGFCSGVLLGFVLSVLSRSWWWFSIAKTWLAMRGAIPWRLMEFLEDAHRLGVLRQVGARYQFRHAAIQDWIAQSPEW